MLKEMRHVYAVYEEKSFSKAAKKMFISQPALSKMIKQAEIEIGAPIFDRSTVPLTLTREGRVYITHIRQIMHLEESLKSYFDDLNNLKTGSLVVGGSSFFCSFVFPKLFGSFSARYPNISLGMREGNIFSLRDGLEDESIDLILETSIHEADPLLNTYLYQTEDIVLAVPEKFPINASMKNFQIPPETLSDSPYIETIPPVPLEAFKDIPFVFLTEGNDLFARGMAFCKEAGFTPKIVLQVEQILTATNLTAAGTGATFSRPAVPAHHSLRSGICYYRLGGPLAKRKILFSSKKSRTLSPAMKAFLELAGVTPTNPKL